MRIHLVGMPHFDPVRTVEWCAFSQKTRRLCDMLSGLGHEVIYYGGPSLEATVAEHVVVASAEDRIRWFGGETWEERVFDRWSPDDLAWRQMNSAAIGEIDSRLDGRDIIGLTMGSCQRAIADAFPGKVVAEVGIGYEGTLVQTHWCVESEAWRHFLYGRHKIGDGRFYDTVIPNAFDPADYDFRDTKDDYLLYLGRMIPKKGLAIVAELAKHHRVITAGQGDQRVPGAEHVGVVVGDDKRKLLAGARALLAPTTYIEPFGGVVVEAMLSGTPVITTPWGAFSETVLHGVTGWRCSTLLEFQKAAGLADQLLPAQIRNHAAHRYSTAAVAPRYDAWLCNLGTIYGEGWYS